MRLIRPALPPLLARQVHQIWLFESACGLPVGDLRTVVPNGRTRLILPLVGGLTASAGSRRWEVPAGRAVLVGQWDNSRLVSQALSLYTGPPLVFQRMKCNAPT